MPFFHPKTTLKTKFQMTNTRFSSLTSRDWRFRVWEDSGLYRAIHIDRRTPQAGNSQLRADRHPLGILSLVCHPSINTFHFLASISISFTSLEAPSCIRIMQQPEGRVSLNFSVLDLRSIRVNSVGNIMLNHSQDI